MDTSPPQGLKRKRTGSEDEETQVPIVEGTKRHKTHQSDDHSQLLSEAESINSIAISDPDRIANHLPAGWTEDRFRNPTDEDLNNLGAEEAEKFMAREVYEAHQVTAKVLGSDWRLKTPPKQQSQAIETVKLSRYDEWGYVSFRGTYKDEERWEQFQKAFDEFVEIDIDQRAVEHDIEFDPEVRERLTWYYIEDDQRNDIPPEECQRWFESLKASGEPPIPEGMDIAICLLVNEGSIDSLLNRTEESIPYVVAIDLKDPDLFAVEAGYRGYCKIAVASLVEEFYHMFVGEYPPLTLSELYYNAKPILRWI